MNMDTFNDRDNLMVMLIVAGGIVLTAFTFGHHLQQMAHASSSSAHTHFPLMFLGATIVTPTARPLGVRSIHRVAHAAVAPTHPPPISPRRPCPTIGGELRPGAALCRHCLREDVPMMLGFEPSGSSAVPKFAAPRLCSHCSRSHVGRSRGSAGSPKLLAPSLPSCGEGKAGKPGSPHSPSSRRRVEVHAPLA